MTIVFFVVTLCHTPSFPSILDPPLRSPPCLPCRYAQTQKKWRRHAALATFFFYWFSCSASPIKYGKKTLQVCNGYRNDSLMVSKFISSRAAGLAVEGSGMRSEMRSAIMSVIRMSSWLSRPSMLPYEPSSLCS